MYFVTFIFLVTLLFLCILKTVTKPRNFPPGPTWYPFVGSRNILQREAIKHGAQWKALAHLAKKYSTDILGLKLGREVVVFVCGLENIREVSNRKEFEGRSDSLFGGIRTYKKRIGITFTEGHVWKVQRSFFTKYLRDIGMGKLQTELKIVSQLEYITNYIEMCGDNFVDTRPLVSTSMINLLWKYIAGKNIKKEKLYSLIHMITERTKIFDNAGGWLNEFPWIRFIIPGLSGYNLLLSLDKFLLDVVEDTIKEHLSGKILEDDFIYAYLEEIKNNSDTFTLDNLKGICMDMLIATAQTTSSVVHFAFIILIQNPDIHEKVYQEINNHLKDNTPSWSDSSRLLYTTAFLQEVYRYYTIAPISGPRRALCDTMLNRYFIPKDSTVLTCLGNLHTDPKEWDEPDTFNPERFIKDGKLKYSEYFLPFGVGKRRCPASALAKPFVFIILVGILQKFQISSADVPPSPDPIIGLLSEPQHFKAKFTRQ